MLQGMIEFRFTMQQVWNACRDVDGWFHRVEGPVWGATFLIEPYAAEERQWLIAEVSWMLGRTLRFADGPWRMEVQITGRCGPLVTRTTAPLSPWLEERLLAKWVDHIASWRAHQKQITTGSDFTGNQVDAVA